MESFYYPNGFDGKLEENYRDPKERDALIFRELCRGSLPEYTLPCAEKNGVKIYGLPEENYKE